MFSLASPDVFRSPLISGSTHIVMTRCGLQARLGLEWIERTRLRPAGDRHRRHHDSRGQLATPSQASSTFRHPLLSGFRRADGPSVAHASQPRTTHFRYPPSSLKSMRTRSPFDPQRRHPLPESLRPQTRKRGSATSLAPLKRRSPSTR